MTRYTNGESHPRYKPVGTECLSSKGYWRRKVNDGPVMYLRWKLLHIINWTEVNGPIPEGYVLTVIGGRSDPRPENWKLIPRESLPTINGNKLPPLAKDKSKEGIVYSEASDELKPTILALAELRGVLARRRKGLACHMKQ